MKGGGEMGKEKQDKSYASLSERHLKAIAGLNALHNTNTIGNPPAVEIIKEGLKALADMPAAELGKLIAMMEDSKDNKIK